MTPLTLISTLTLNTKADPNSNPKHQRKAATAGIMKYFGREEKGGVMKGS